MEKLFTKLLIVGNGFDLAHGYKTRFSDFKDKLENDKTSIELINNYKSLLEHMGVSDNGCNWYELENISKMVVRKCSEEDLEKGHSIYNDRIQSIFLEMNSILKDYLRNETKRDFNKLDNITKEIDECTLAINFNYTDTLEKYGCVPYYPHGTLKEDFIVLGYDGYDDDSFDFTGYDIKYLRKDYGRDRLQFNRYLKNYYSFDDKSINKISDDYDKYLFQANTGKGFDSNDYNNIKWKTDFRELHLSYIDNKNTLINDYLFSNIKEVVLLGHSIKSDLKYLEEILSKCPKLESISIYTHNREKYKELSEKVKVLQKFACVDSNQIFIKTYK